MKLQKIACLRPDTRTPHFRAGLVCAQVSYPDPACAAFALRDLVTLVVLVAICCCVLVAVPAKTQPTSRASECQNNIRQLTVAWRQWADDHSDTVLACEDMMARPNWAPGWLTYATNRANYDIRVDLAKTPLWTYIGGNGTLFKCPSDESTAAHVANFKPQPRIRSYSMNSAFGRGKWLPDSAWRIYARSTEVANPANTFILADEHPGSINDGCLYVSCKGAEAGDPPGSAQIIDFPASYHDGGANLSFADGRVDARRWIGSTLRAPFQDRAYLDVNIPAGDSWLDIRWLAQYTTVKK